MSARAIALLLVLTAACADPIAQPPELALLLPAQASAGDRADATNRFDQWMDANIRTPGAAIRLLRIGTSRGDVETMFAACVPKSWGAPNAVANKAAFIEKTKQGFHAALEGRAIASVQAPPASGGSVLTVLPALDSRGQTWVWAATGAPLHTAVVCDRSISAVGDACTTRMLLLSYDAWLQHASVIGSSFTVWSVGRDIGSARRAFEITAPALPLVDRVAMLLAARGELATLAATEPPDAGSAIAEALTVAIANLADRHGQRQLFVLSDLRQTTAGVWAFDDRIPPPKTFVAWLDAERLLPDSRGIHIRVCGLHFGSTPGALTFDARHAADLKAAWMDAFTAMHPASISLSGECDGDSFSTLQEVTR